MSSSSEEDQLFDITQQQQQQVIGDGILDSFSTNSTDFISLDTDDTLSSISAANNATNSSVSTAVLLPEFYRPLYKIIGSLFVGVIFAVGLVGNLMVVLVVWRTRSMRTPTNCYLVSLAVADVLLLVSAPLPTLIEFFLIVDQSVFGAVGCAAMVFAQYLGVNVSSMSITAFTIERYIAICHPMRAQTICTVTRAKRIILFLWTFGIVYCAPWLALITTKPLVYDDGTVIERCTFKLARHSYLTYYMADLVIFYVVPLILTCILYALIARILFKSTRPSGTPGRSTVGGGACGQQQHTAAGAAAAQRSSAATASNAAARVKRSTCSTSSRVQVTKMLAVVVCVFAVLWLPYRAYVVYNSFASRRYEDLWFLLFCRLMVYTNSAINPILYNAMSVKFCRAFRRLLLCGRVPGGGNSSATVVGSSGGRYGGRTTTVGGGRSLVARQVYSRVSMATGFSNGNTATDLPTGDD